jgi:hypothetical protein
MSFEKKGFIEKLRNYKEKGYNITWTHWLMDKLTDADGHDNLIITVKDSDGKIIKEFQEWINIRECVMVTNEGADRTRRRYHELNKILGRYPREGVPPNPNSYPLNKFGYRGKYEWLFEDEEKIRKRQIKYNKWLDKMRRQT